MSDRTGPDTRNRDQEKLEEVKRLWAGEGTSLYSDIGNNTRALGLFAGSKRPALWRYLSAPVKTHGEYFSGWQANYPSAANYILENSDPAAVAEYDANVATFNTDRERILRDEDWQAVQDFCEKLEEILERKRQE